MFGRDLIKSEAVIDCTKNCYNGDNISPLFQVSLDPQSNTTSGTVWWTRRIGRRLRLSTRKSRRWQWSTCNRERSTNSWFWLRTVSEMESSANRFVISPDDIVSTDKRTLTSITIKLLLCPLIFQPGTNLKLIHCSTQSIHSPKSVLRRISAFSGLTKDFIMSAGRLQSTATMSCGCTLSSSTWSPRTVCMGAERRGILRSWFLTWTRMSYTPFKCRLCPQRTIEQAAICWTFMCRRIAGWRLWQLVWPFQCCSL